MAQSDRKVKEFEIVCPTCGAKITIDAKLGKVISHEPPPKGAPARDLDHATELLEKEAARREALFKQSTADQKVKSELLQRKFEEAFKKTKDQPTGPPLKDIDLD